MLDPEQLFLLEFLVDSVYIHRLCGKEISNRDWLLCGQTVVSFQFLNFQAQAISDNDFPNSECPGAGPQKFESGKSCLFSIPERELLRAPGEFIINIGVFKRQPAGILPECVQVGEAKIDITNEFTAVVCDILRNPKESPASNAIKDTFIVHTPGSNEPVGMIRLFIRLSCFGKSIVTEFSLGNGESYLFKGTEDNVYRCQQMKRNLAGPPPCGVRTDVCPAKGGGGGWPMFPDPGSLFGQSVCPGMGASMPPTCPVTSSPPCAPMSRVPCPSSPSPPCPMAMGPPPAPPCPMAMSSPPCPPPCQPSSMRSAGVGPGGAADVQRPRGKGSRSGSASGRQSSGGHKKSKSRESRPKTSPLGSISPRKSRKKSSSRASGRKSSKNTKSSQMQGYMEPWNPDSDPRPNSAPPPRSPESHSYALQSCVGMCHDESKFSTRNATCFVPRPRNTQTPLMCSQLLDPETFFSKKAYPFSRPSITEEAPRLSRNQRPRKDSKSRKMSILNQECIAAQVRYPELAPETLQQILGHVIHEAMQQGPLLPDEEDGQGEGKVEDTPEQLDEALGKQQPSVRAWRQRIRKVILPPCADYAQRQSQELQGFPARPHGPPGQLQLQQGQRQSQVRNQSQSSAPGGALLASQQTPLQKPGGLQQGGLVQPMPQQPLKILQEPYRYIPAYVDLAGFLFPDLFWSLIDYFLETQEWVPYEMLNPFFQVICRQFQVDANTLLDMPGFAPRWVKLLRDMDEAAYRMVVGHFFFAHRFPSWQCFPQHIVKAFEDAHVGEFDFARPFDPFAYLRPEEPPTSAPQNAQQRAPQKTPQKGAQKALENYSPQNKPQKGQQNTPQRGQQKPPQKASVAPPEKKKPSQKLKEFFNL